MSTAEVVIIVLLAGVVIATGMVALLSFNDRTDNGDE